MAFQELNGPAVPDSALMVIVTFGSLTGSMLPFVLKRLEVESRPLHWRHSWRHWSMSREFGDLRLRRQSGLARDAPLR
jgi:hypothetical protein